MTCKRFYIYALISPLALPLALYLLQGHIKLPEITQEIISCGGKFALGYLMGLGLFFWRLYAKPVAISSAFWALPVFVAPMCMLTTALFLMLQWGDKFGIFARSLIVHDGFDVLAGGYLYVVAIHAIGFMLRKISFIR